MKFKSLIAIIALTIGTAFAQPVTIITTNGPGSLVDTAVRYFAPLIEKELGRDIIIKNMPGADGMIAMREYASLPHDGNTLLAGGTSVSFSYVKESDFKPQEHFTPFAGLVRSESLLLVPANSPVTDIKSLIELSKKKGKIAGGSSGIASTINFAMMDEQLGTNIIPVEYKQTAQIPMDLAQGDLTDFAIAGAGNMAIRSFVSSGKIRPIAILGYTQSQYYKETKTLTQQGYKSMEDFGWGGLFIHKNTPEEVKKVLFDAIQAAMKSEKGAAFEQLQGEPKRFMVGEKELTALQKREGEVYKQFVPKIKR